MKKPHIGIIYQENLPELIFNDFIDTVSSNNLSLRMEAVPNEPYALSIEWLMPTAIIAYISKPYFDSFLKEMGKDHYNLLKKGLLSLKDFLIGEKAPKITIMTSTSAKNKTTDNPYSLLFSIIADIKDNKQFKLLIRTNISNEEYQKTINSFLIFLDQYHSKTLDEKTLIELENQIVVHRTIFISYNDDIEKLEFLNPISN